MFYPEEAALKRLCESSLTQAYYELYTSRSFQLSTVEQRVCVASGNRQQGVKPAVYSMCTIVGELHRSNSVRRVVNQSIVLCMGSLGRRGFNQAVRRGTGRVHAVVCPHVTSLQEHSGLTCIPTPTQALAL